MPSHPSTPLAATDRRPLSDAELAVQLRDLTSVIGRAISTTPHVIGEPADTLITNIAVHVAAYLGHQVGGVTEELVMLRAGRRALATWSHQPLDEQAQRLFNDLVDAIGDPT
jgi:hypothetical protein